MTFYSCLNHTDIEDIEDLKTGKPLPELTQQNVKTISVSDRNWPLSQTVEAILTTAMFLMAT